jgi:OFA family oxalate/formate antiporter-like MFS transporter
MMRFRCPATGRPGLQNRWWIVAAAVAMQLSLGGANAWSVFRDPFIEAFGWSIAEVTWAYTINVVLFGLSAFAGGLAMARYGPRTVGLVASVLFGLGFFLVSSAPGWGRRAHGAR